MAQVTERKEISLPAPDITGDAFLEYLLQERRSVREYQNAGLSLAQVAQLLWAAQGITDANGFLRHHLRVPCIHWNFMWSLVM